MLDMESLATGLEGIFVLYQNPESETTYLSETIAGGAIEIYNDGTIMYITWDRTGATSDESEIGNVPQDIPVQEQVCFIKIFVRKFESILDRNTDPDQYYTERECRRAISENRSIDHGAAKTIASFNIDDVPDILLFLSNGSIESPALWSHLYSDYAGNSMYNRLSEQDQLFADSLGSYLAERRQNGQTGPVENWSTLWVDRS